MDKKKCEAIATWYYTPDMQGVPDGKKNLKTLTCSCCGEKLMCVEIESVDCGTAYHFESNCGHCSYSWYDLIEEC